jgi:hypothetical protein
MTGATSEDYARDREEIARRAQSPERRAQRAKALESLQELHRKILERTGGKGIPDEWIQEALDEADDH